VIAISYRRSALHVQKAKAQNMNDQKRFFRAVWGPPCFAKSPFLVRRAVRRKTIGKELLEQAGIVSLSNVWVTLDTVDKGDLPSG